MVRLDLNCDLGEGAGQDAELMPLVTSANIACGGHTGDAATMTLAVALAHRYGVAVGAHPGFPDGEYFGRRELRLPTDEIRRLVRGQIEALATLTPLRHVKPHGGLYNLAARDAEVARAVAEAVRAVDASLVLFGPSGSELLRAGQTAGLRVASEAFADRAYAPDGTLVPRGTPGALLGVGLAMAQVLALVRTGKVRATDGSEVTVQADTVCVHGDGPEAVELARSLRSALIAEGVELRAIGGENTFRPE